MQPKLGSISSITCFPLAVFSRKDTVMVIAALIQNPYPDTPADHFRINSPAQQPGYRHRPPLVFLRQQNGCSGFSLRKTSEGIRTAVPHTVSPPLKQSPYSCMPGYCHKLFSLFE